MKISEVLVSAMRVNNTGELGKLEEALALWAEGKMSAAQPLLLQLELLARQYRQPQYGYLYRGMLVDDTASIKTGMSITTKPEAPLSSWSLSRKAVQEFMWGWDRPWALIRKPGSELDVFLDLVLFQKQARPFTHVDTQKEVIVKMPPLLNVARNEFSFYKR